MNDLITQSKQPIRMAFAVLVALAMAALLAIAATPATAASGDLDRAVKALRDISTLRADFVQTDRTGQSVSGVLTLKRPGKIRFEYEDAVNMLIVSDGRTLSMVDYDVRQVQRWPIKNSPLGVLLDPERDIASYGKLVPTASPQVVSVKVRDPKRPEYGMITLILIRNPSAPGGLELVSWVALDSQNKRTTVRLSNHKYGVAVPDRMFKYRDPRGASRR